jgi:hypothetical protein
MLFSLRRYLFLTLALAFLVSGLGAFEAHAASVTLPTALDPGLTTTVLSTPSIVQATSNGNTTTVSGAENLKFSAFSYISTATGTGTAYAATGVSVGAFTVLNETGLVFNAGWGVTGVGTQDEAITYTVTAPAGQLITDAYLAINGSAAHGGTASVSENLYSGLTPIAYLYADESNPPTSISDLVTFAGVRSITLVEKDIDLAGNASNSTAALSFVDQGFSSSDGRVPEPTSMALLGIGMAGFLAYRRLFKRAATV